MKVKDIRMSNTYMLAGMFEAALNGLPVKITGSFVKPADGKQRPARVYKVSNVRATYEVSAANLAPYDPAARLTPEEAETYKKAVADVETMLRYLRIAFGRKVNPVKVNSLNNQWSLTAVRGGSYVDIELSLNRDFAGTLHIEIDVSGLIGIDEHNAYDIDLDLYDTSPEGLVTYIKAEVVRLHHEVTKVAEKLSSIQSLSLP